MHLEGNDTGTLVFSALFMAARLGPIFVLGIGILSMIASFIALQKKLIGFSILFAITPLTIFISSYLWYLTLSTGEGWAVARTVCSWVLGISILMPFILSLLILKKSPPN